MQNEIDLQVAVTQEFGRNVQHFQAEQNKRKDALKAKLENGEIDQADYDEQISRIQKQSLLVNMVAGGLMAPSDSVLGIAAATLAPAASYEVEQYFKKEGKEGSFEHIATHAVIGALTASANGGNAFAGAVSAGGAETIAPIVAKVLYGKDNSQNLTADEKETVVSVTTAIGTLVGGAIGDSSANAYIGSLNAKNAVENNSLHIAKNGVVAQNIDDGDMNIYQYNFNCKTQEECRNMDLKSYDSSKKIVGQVMWQDSFVSPDTRKAGGKIYLGQDIEPYIYQLNYQVWLNDTPKTFAQKSFPRGEYDVKSNYPGHEGYSFHGFLFNGKYISLRDAGNILAGMNAAVLDIPFKDFQKASGALHAGGKYLGKPFAGISYFTGIPFGRSPMYGELPYQYEKSKYGYILGKNRLDVFRKPMPSNIPTIGEIFNDFYNR